MSKIKAVRKPSWFKYFFNMGAAEREIVKAYHARRPRDYSWELVEHALQNVESQYLISTIEPSMIWGKYFFEEGCKIAAAGELQTLINKCKDFSPEDRSDLATLDEVVLFNEYRAAMGWWNLEYFCTRLSIDDAGIVGEKVKLFNSSISGKVEIGGFCDGIGNTYKIVRDGFKDYKHVALLGKAILKKDQTQTTCLQVVKGFDQQEYMSFYCNMSTPVIVLRK